RIPLLAFAAIQAALLPRLARLASEHKHDDFREGLMRLVVVVTSLCIVGTIAATPVGPQVGKKLFPTKWALGNRDMFFLTLPMSTFILALTLAQGLIALKAYRQNAIAWVAGVVAFVATDAIAADEALFLRNEIAFLVGAIVSALLVGVFLFVRMRRGGASLEDL